MQWYVTWLIPSIRSLIICIHVTQNSFRLEPGTVININCHKLTSIVKHYLTLPFRYSKILYLKVGSFASFIHTSLLGFGWKRVAINSGPKNPKDLLKKKRVRRHNSNVFRWCGAKVSREGGRQGSGVILVTSAWFKITKSEANSLLAAL
ncbi:hypothetical protein TNCV_2324111 [Trichonephila clavipes]|nr:hypothetical protein TNCV_2324111 [Trichonephila clavipes]